ncbi:hypothetical protein Pcinc_031795 [Petrolisthes cinctipes]|uniref:Protein regulator of cytokinesis 1 n=1 Tax=Petrolisthes cinctipes TaxID=88211 RepID=A0AAE1K0D0_PETCI|nr:hypothetical protein Pcinc_031795 [Petrolisthes cinctipes]
MLENAELVLKETWNVMGFSEEEQAERTVRLYDALGSHLQEIVNGERSLKRKYLKKIAENSKRFYELNAELEAGLPDLDDSLGLLQLDRSLKNSLKILYEEVKQRQEKLNELREREKELCDYLKEDQIAIDLQKEVPSKGDMAAIERCIQTLLVEKEYRLKTFRRLKKSLEQLMEDLEQPNKSRFEVNVLSQMEELFTLSQANLQQLNRLVDGYEQKVKENKQECLELQEKIQNMYSRLEIDPSEHLHVFGHTPSVLAKLHEEWQRLDDLKRENLSRLINQQRRQLEAMWEQCYVGEDDMQAFQPYFSDDYTEESLEAHDKEVQRLQAYYEEWKGIFMDINKRDKLWRKFIMLEEKSNDPNRLKSNRGGTLLQEEKERSRVKQELPRVERKLEDLIATWEKQQGRPFLIEGKRMNDYIVDQWHHYHQQKEQEKEKKHHVRAKQLEIESRMGTRNQSLLQKRKLPRNETMKSSKLRRIGEDSSCSSFATMHSPVRERRGVLHEFNHNTPTILASPGSKANTITFSSDNTSYSHFSEELMRRSEHEKVRSSVINAKSRTPLLAVRPTPRRPPPGLPKTPMTLPRMATRRSPRLNSGQRLSPRNLSTHWSSRRNLSTQQRSPAPAHSTTAAFRSPYHTSSRLTSTRKNKLSFLI